MTVTYVRSPSFSAHTTSPPQSPLVPSASCTWSTSPAIGPTSPRAASRAFGTSVPAAAASDSASAEKLTTSASAPVLADHLSSASSILIRNERMEAGLSLRRSPLIPTAEFEPEPSTPATYSPRLPDNVTLVDQLESVDARYEPTFTGDIDLHNDRFVYRRPYVDRGLSHTKRRTQLILEQKYHLHRLAGSPGTSPNEPDSFKTSAASFPRSQSARRPGTAPQHSSSPHTPDWAPAHLNSASRTLITSSGGLRELTTGASAQPASKRASWIRRTRDFETHSDSHHTHSSGLLEAAPITASIKASRRHSSFLTGDYRTATLIPILASNSFDARSKKDARRRSYMSDKSASPLSNLSTSPVLVASSGLVGAPVSKRDSMLSNDSSATSSSKDGRLSVDNVEFEGDDLKHQAQSSASSGSGHDESVPVGSMKGHVRSATDADSKTVEVFITPRSSAEHEQGGAKSSIDPLSETDSSRTTEQAKGPSHDAVEVAQIDCIESEKLASASLTDAELVAAPAISSTTLGPVETAVVPPTPTPTAPEWASREAGAVSPTSSPSASFRPLPRADEPGASPKSPFGTLIVPQGKANGSGRGSGRRDSSTSITSAASSTSTYRIRRKAVPSDVDPSERRPSAASGISSDAGEFSPQPSPAQEKAPLPPPKENGVHSLSAARDPSTFMRMAQEAARAHMLERGAGAGRQRPSTAATASATPAPFGLGIVQQPKASGSSRDVSTNQQLSAGATPTATRTPSRATIKRPTTAPVGSTDQFRAVSDAQKSVLEVEGLQFVLDKEDATKPKAAQDSSPSIPNAVRFVQPQRVGSSGASPAGLTKRDSQTSAKHGSIKLGGASRRGSASTDTAVPANGAPAKSGGWGLEEELQIVDRARNADGGAQKKGAAPRPESMLRTKKATDDKNDVLFKSQDESEDVKAAAREAGIPEGSYAIHPPSMLQLFEASQCLVYNQNGQEVLFGDLFKKRRTLVCFLRHWWCGFCQQFAMSIRNIDPLPLKKANLDFVIVGQGDWQVIKAYREVMQVQYPMFADPKRNVYRALGMTLRTNDANPACARPDYASLGMTKGILVAIKKGLFDMPIRNPGDMKLLGGDFILGPGLQCSFTHRMTTADGHMDIPRILAQAGCDLSLKTPKPMFTLNEKEARAAMLAGGNSNRRGQPRSLGRSRGKKTTKSDAGGTLDTSFGSAAGSTMAGSMSVSSSNTRFARPSLWGRFPGRFSKSQVSLDQSASTADLSNDFSPARGLAAGPRSASAMRKVSYDGRVRDSFETQQTDIEFESRATSFDTRGRPSDVSAPVGMSALNKTQSMSELRRRFEMGALGSLRAKSGRQEPSGGKLSLEVPSANRDRLQHSISSKSLRGAQSNGASTPVAKPVNPTGGKAGSNGSVPMSVFRNNVISQASGSAAPAPAATGLGIAAPGVDPADGAVGSSAVEKAAVVDGTAPSIKATVTAVPTTAASFSAPGSFLTDLDVFDSLSASPAPKSKNHGEKGMLSPSIFDSGLSPSQFSDSGFTPEAADADSDTEPSMSAAQSPARSQRTTAASTQNSPGGGALGPSASSSFYSFNTFRAKRLEHLVEEADEEADESHSRDQMRHKSGEDEEGEEDEEDEEEDEEEENDEPIEFEDDRSGGF
ncbi:hypothetical protein EX895_001448 [Sporisorium graminicola]|uniref:Thioredoxin domain-containing protein n=1 Tax=Sporisorium graminicola TaxID=280036 RepID=A0A4U7KY69_9BASI|nr:hypothetical protein EX895_001448 [Sporisorium graminicola]TKY89663.1 hypothetical protein EX895_001448 [Sporisorium graminicola]